MKKKYFFIMIIVSYGVLFTGITNGQVDNSTYTSRSCKVYNIEYIDNLQAYTSPNLKKQEYFINTDYFKRYVDSKNQQVPNCPANGGGNLSSYSDTSSSQNRFTAPNGKIYFISEQGGEYTADGLSNQKTFKTIDELKNYIKIRNPLAILSPSSNARGNQETYQEDTNNQQHGSADNQYSQDKSNQNSQDQYNQNNQSRYNQDTSNQYNQNQQTENSTNIIYTTQLANCSGLPENGYWINSTFTQTYYGTIRLPTSKSATYSNDSSTDCAFLCYSGYTRNSYNNTCEAINKGNELLETLKRIIDGTDEDEDDDEDRKGEIRFKECNGLPDNAKWINGEFKQTWNGSSRKPKKVNPEYSSDDEIECSFKCKTNYKRNSRTEECEKKSSGGGSGGGGGGGGGGNSSSYSCQGVLPSNTSLNNPNATPSSNINYFYNETSTSACSFKCNSSYTWNPNSQSCEQTTLLTCTGLPGNAKRINSRFRLIWDGSSRIQNTTKNTCTNDSSSSLECSFTCNDNYKCNSDNSGCIPSSTPICKNLPDNATPNNDVIPNEDTDYTFDTITNKICTFHCNTNYIWNPDSKSCDKNGGGTGENPSYSCQGSLPEHASLNNSNATPSSNINYFYDESSSTACSFKCNTGYTWMPSSQTCDKIEGGNGQGPASYSCQGSLPEHASLNNSNATPSSNINYFYDESSSAACSFKCNTGYTWSPSSQTCIANTQTVNCTGSLPEHATRINNKFSQTRNGTDWTPPYIENTFTGNNNVECSFICEDNYNWNSNSKTCNSNGQGSASYSCQGSLPEHASLNNSNATPSSNINYFYDESSSTACSFKCNTGYTWTPSSQTCDKIEGGNGQGPASYSCQGSLPEHASLNNSNATPSSNINYFYDESSSAACAFKCNTGYTWSPSSQTCNKIEGGNGQEPTSYSCQGTPPENAHANNNKTPSENINYYYNDTDTTEPCTFQCNEHFKRNKTACVLETQKAKCTGNPDNTRRIVDEFTQTWDISNGRRTPLPGEKEKTYNEAEDNNIECSFACLDNEHFTRKPEINKCEANTRKVSCEGNNTDNKQIPNHSSWINSEFTQTWNGSEWSPKKHAYYRSDSYESDECTFSCDNYYEQDKANYQCKPTCIGAEYIRSHATEKKGPGSESSEINVYNSEDEQENTERPNCSYTCNNNEGYYKKGNDCVKYTCTNIPEYAELIKDSDTELKNDDDATSKLCDENGKYNGEECSGNKVKCAYKCDEYHKYENGTCIYKTVVNDRIYLCGAGAIDYSIPLQRTNGLEDVQNLIKDIKLETYAGNDVTEVAYGGIPQENNDNLCESNAQVHDNEAEVSNDEKRWEWDCELKADTRVRTHCFARKLHGQCGGAANECDYDNCFKECKYNCNGNKNCAGACVEKCNCNNDNLCNNDSRKVFGNNSSWDCGYEAGQTIGGRVSCTAKDVGTLGNTYCGVATGYTYAGLAYPDNEDEFKLCQNGSDLVIDNGAYITRDYGNEQLNRYCETNNNSYKCSANMFQASCGDASTNTEGYIKIDKDTQNLCKNDRGNPIDITDTGLEWRWTCKIDYSNDNDSSTFGTDTETCTAKRGGCNNEPTNTNGLNKSTDNYIGDIRETREYVEPSTFNENDVCKWTCKSGYTKDGNTCVPNSNGTNSNVNESSKNGTW